MKTTIALALTIVATLLTPSCVTVDPEPYEVEATRTTTTATDPWTGTTTRRTTTTTVED